MKLKYFAVQVVFILFFISFTPLLFSQSSKQSWRLYDDSEVMIIKVTMEGEDYNWMISNTRIDSLHNCTITIKNKYIDTTVTDIGIRVRGNTSRDSRKLSFKLSFDDFKPGREFLGVDKLNLNGEHNDPSISRAKIAWDIFQSAGIKASRASHTALYINDIYHGLYISIEHLDREFLKKNYDDSSGNLFKCLYPADLVYQQGMTENSIKYTKSFPAYELMTNKEGDDYSQLFRLIKIVNSNTTNFADSIDNILFVDEYLKYQAMNLLIGSWDDYWSLNNNYYLYFEPAQGKFRWIPYDYDNTFGISWWPIDWANANPYDFPKVVPGKRPLAEKIMTHPEYRNLYTHFLDFYSKNIVNIANLNKRIDDIRDLITPYALNDQYRKLDYGFNTSDFFNSFISLDNQHVKTGIKQFIDLRSKSIQTQLKYVASKPIVYNIQTEPVNPAPDDSITVYVSAFAHDGLEKVTLEYHPGMLTVIYFHEMKYSPVPNTKIVNEADRYKVTLAPLGKNGYGRFKIYVESKGGSFARYPLNSFVEIKNTSAQLTTGLAINEIMADNKTIIQDPAGDYDDWIELHNYGTSAINLAGKYLTDKKDNPTKWKFPNENLLINPGEFLIIWCDEDQDKNQPGVHTNFKLSADGEFIGLVEDDGITWVDSTSFPKLDTDKSFSRVVDGTGNWLIVSPTPGKSNNITSLKEDESLPKKFSLEIYPNPFNPETTIRFLTPEVSDINIQIFDILGKLVFNSTLNNINPGVHSLIWNAKDIYGKILPSGNYFVKLSSKNYFETKKIVLIK